MRLRYSFLRDVTVWFVWFNISRCEISPTYLILLGSNTINAWELHPSYRIIQIPWSWRWFYFNALYQTLWTDANVSGWQKGCSHILPACPFPPSSTAPELVFVGWVRSPSSCTNLMPTQKRKKNIQLGVAGHTYVRLKWLVSPQAKNMCRILLSACKQKPQTIENLSWEHCVTFQVSMLATKCFEM